MRRRKRVPRRRDTNAPDSKRGPASLPAPVSPDFSHKPGRVMQPGFGGKLHPRRQGHAGFASVVEAGRFPLPKELRLPASAARSDNAEAPSKPCWMQVPIRSRISVPACAVPSTRGLPNLLRGLPTRNLRTPFGVLRPEFRTPLEVLHSELPLRFRKSFRFPITSGHPVPVLACRPKAAAPFRPV